MTNFLVDQSLMQAKKHAKKGQIAEAQKIYNKILEAFPKNNRALIGLASLGQVGPPDDVVKQLINLYNSGQLIEVVKKTEELLKQFSKSFVIWNIQGAANQSLGKISQASSAFKTVTILNPKSPEGFNNFGVTLKDQGKHKEALEAFNTALSIKPDYPETYNNIGLLYQCQGKLNDAITSYNKAISIKNDYADVYNNMGNAFQEKGDMKEAIKAYKNALSLRPNYAEAYNNIGDAFQEEGEHEKAIKAFNQALSIKPDFAEAFYNLGITLKDQGELQKAAEAFNKALSIKPDHAETYNSLGATLSKLGRFEESESSYKRALSLKPDYAEVYNNLGATLKEQGKLEEAEECITQAITSKPDYAEAHRQLSFIKKFYEYDEQFLKMEELYNDKNISLEQLCHLNFGLAKASEDLGEYDKSFKHYSEGNALRKKLLKYDISHDIKVFKQLKASYPSIPSISLDIKSFTNNPTPVFIIGMPRSGTTLVEQIISSHSQVTGAGELPYVAQLNGIMTQELNSVEPYNNSNTMELLKITENSLLTFRESYLTKLKSLSNGNIIVTDKMPHNFKHTGLIACAFPEAKIIHVKRNPAATCWANYKQYFVSKTIGYCYDLKDIVDYYGLYKDIMSFWNTSIGDRIYELDYELLTINQEDETRKLIKHLGLSWEDRCLSPEDNKRNVATTSNLQVREKVYQGSSEQWKRFKPFLNGVLDNLNKSYVKDI